MKKRLQQTQSQPLMQPQRYDGESSYIVPPNINFPGGASTALDPNWSKEVINTIPCADFPSVYDLQANTMATSCPDVTWMVHSPR